MRTCWILIANAHRARIFEQHGVTQPLTELNAMVYPNNHESGADSGKGHGRTAHHGTQFEPHTETQDKEQLAFARQIAASLNEGANAHRYNELVLMTSSPMLGALRPLLNPAAQALLKRSVTTDLTRYQNAELQERVTQALALPQGNPL